MKSERLRRAIGGIDADIIEAAENRPANYGGQAWIKWGAVAAAVVIVTAGAFTLPGLLKQGGFITPPNPRDSTAGTEPQSHLEKQYDYSIDAGKFSGYVRGRVIEDGKIGKTLEKVTVTAGWFDADGNRLTEEHANAEVYEIDGVSTDVAIAIKFLDKLEAETTTHFYVAMNPEADLTPVQDYIIGSAKPTITGEDAGDGLVTETTARGEI